MSPAARHAAPSVPRRGYREWLSGLGALGLVLLLVVGIPAVLIASTGVPFGHGQLPSGSHLWAQLRGPDSGQLLLDVLLIVAWAGWVAFTVTAVTEAVALGRHTVAPALHGLGALQPATGRLIAAAAILLPASSTVLHLAVTGGTVHPPTLAPRHITAAPTAHTHATPAGSQKPTKTPVFQTVQTDVVLPVYVVGSDPTGQRDTLWSIAARHLGDPMRWYEIAQLNLGEIQPDGAVFTDPALIRNGWTLRLPADATGLTASNAQPVKPPVPPTARTSTPTPTTGLPSLTPVPAPVVASPDPTPAQTTPSPLPSSTQPSLAEPSHDPMPTMSKGLVTPPADGHARRTSSIRLGSDSEIGGELAAALLLAFSLRRLRRRQHYQTRAPRPAQLTGHPPVPPPLRQILAQAPPADGQPIGVMSGPLATTSPPGQWQLGTRNDQPIGLSWLEYPVLGLSGPGAAGVLRSLLMTAICDCRVGTDILAIGDVLSDVLPEASTLPAAQRCDLGDATRRVQLEVARRSRQFAEADAPDAAGYRERHPEDPVPVMLIVGEHTLADQPGLPALLGANAHLDIVALLCGDEQPPTAVPSITVNADGTAAAAAPQSLAEMLDGASLFRLSPSDATTSLHESMLAPNPERVPTPVTENDGNLINKPPTVTAVSAIPAASSDGASDQPVSPIRVQLFGPIRIWGHGTEVSTGLRHAGRELLAWYLMHPDGRPMEAAIDAIWPDDSPERGRQRFWNALTNLRSRLRADHNDDTKLQILTRAGDNYHPNVDEFDVDLWTFQTALYDAAHAEDPGSQRSALQRAIASYGGPFADGTDFLWTEPIREEFHRRALDAHVAYATLNANDGHLEQAIVTLEKALQLDPYAEDVYRRLMRLHRTTNRKENVRLLWKQLQTRLADIDSEPEDETTRTYRQCR